MRCALAFFVLVMSLVLGSCSKLGIGPAPLIEDAKGCYLAAQGIEASLAVGITYQDFSAEVRELSKEIYLATDKTKYVGSSDNRVSHLLEGYRHLLEMYRDSEKVWSSQIQDKKYDGESEVIPKKYGVPWAVTDTPERIGDQTFHTRTIAFDPIRQSIWSQASALQETLSAGSYGQSQQPSAKKQDK